MRILCYGDSNTYGYDPRSFFGDRYCAEDRWVALLEAKSNHTAINAGTNGQRIPPVWDGLQLPREHADVDLFLVMLGTNDLLQGASAEETTERMETFLLSLIPNCTNILLIAPPPMKRGTWVPTDALVAESSRLADEYRLLAEKLKICFVDPRPWNIDLAFDGVHFTEHGHHTFANHLMAELGNL